MTIGTGIAVAGVWVMVGMAFISKSTTSAGLYLALAVAAIVTSVIV
jgi:hypothetical protein